MVTQTSSLLDFVRDYYGKRMDVCERHRRTVTYTAQQLHSFTPGGDGSRLLGNTRAVFERHYLDSRAIGNGQSQFLPPL